MAWTSAYALDGFFLFGAPLNVTRYAIDPADNQFGQSTDAYWVARFLIDEEMDVIARLNALMRGAIHAFPIVHLLRRSFTTGTPDWMVERLFYKAWLFGLGSDFFDPRNPGVSTGGQTLAIAFNKADNRHIVPDA